MNFLQKLPNSQYIQYISHHNVYAISIYNSSLLEYVWSGICLYKGKRKQRKSWTIGL